MVCNTSYIWYRRKCTSVDHATSRGFRPRRCYTWRVRPDAWHDIGTRKRWKNKEKKEYLSLIHTREYDSHKWELVYSTQYSECHRFSRRWNSPSTCEWKRTGSAPRNTNGKKWRVHDQSSNRWLRIDTEWSFWVKWMKNYRDQSTQGFSQDHREFSLTRYTPGDRVQ